MIFAAIGDCNGHAPALATALHAIEEEGIMSIFCTGNLAGAASSFDWGKGMSGGEGRAEGESTPATERVIALLRRHEVHTAQGERDRLLLRFEQKSAQLKNKLSPAEFEFLSAAHAQLSPGALEYLRGLHKRVDRTIDGIRIIACHGSPNSQGELIDMDTPHVRLQRIRESLDAHIIVCGGSKEPWHRWADGVLFVGPGIVSTEDGAARYAVVDTEEQQWVVREVLLPVSQ